jgi:hypothetical protein
VLPFYQAIDFGVDDRQYKTGEPIESLPGTYVLLLAAKHLHACTCMNNQEEFWNTNKIWHTNFSDQNFERTEKSMRRDSQERIKENVLADLGHWRP